MAVHMARCVDEIERIGLAVVGVIGQLDGAGLDRDAALTLQLHGVEDLVLHLALVHGVALLEQAVCQRGFAVVNMGDNGKIPDVVQIGHGTTSYFMNLSMAAHRLAMA